mgnify:CR=1 FL=1
MEIGLFRPDLHQFAFRPAQGGQMPAKTTPGVNAIDIVEFAHAGLGDMAVYDGSFT